MDRDDTTPAATGPGIVQDYIEHAKAPITRQCYRRDWTHFLGWCSGRGLPPLPAEPRTVALYLSEMAEVNKPSTLGRRLASISVAHQAEGHPTPTRDITVRNVLSGIRRRHGVRQSRKTPIRASHLQLVAASLSTSPRDLRDKALLLIGYVGALRRSELVALDVADLEFVEAGLRLRIRRSKGDQEGRGVVIGIGYGSNPATCPVKAMNSWLRSGGITSGPVFRPVTPSGRVEPTRLVDRTVSLILKGLAPGLGLDPKEVGGHSLRAGFITDQYAAGTAEAIIMDRSRHRSHAVMSVYRREASLFAFNYAEAAGL